MDLRFELEFQSSCAVVPQGQMQHPQPLRLCFALEMVLNGTSMSCPDIHPTASSLNQVGVFFLFNQVGVLFLFNQVGMFFLFNQVGVFSCKASPRHPELSQSWGDFPGIPLS